MKEYWVYILRCADGKYYTGVTNYIEERVRQHQEGIDPYCFTYKRRPTELVYQCVFREVMDAIRAEKQIKGWSRKKKEALIRGDFVLLHELSMSNEKRQRLAQRNASSPLAQADA
jgi:putative endonuclease